MAHSADKFGQFVGEAVSLAIVGSLIYFVAMPVVGSYLGAVAMNSYYHNHCGVTACVRKGFGYARADWRKREKESHDRTAANLCPDYHNAYWYQQQTGYRAFKWCENYPQFASN